MSGRGGGRGAYYKAKFGGGGRGGRGGRDGGTGGGGIKRDYDDDFSGTTAQATNPNHSWKTSGQLLRVLQCIDGSQYPAYHDIEGSWHFGEDFDLLIDRAQGDAYAAPTRCKVQLSAVAAGIPAALRSSVVRRTAVCDYLTRRLGDIVAASGGDVRAAKGGWGGEKGGEMTVDRPGQHILQRSSVLIQTDGSLEARFTVALPAKGRTVLGQWAATALVHNLPRYVGEGLTWRQQDHAAVQSHVACAEDTEALRDALSDMSLVAFVGNGAVLPRRSGASDLPMTGAIRFQSPPTLESEVRLPNAGLVKGMGIRKGITVVVGGGYNGKSTLLDAIKTGVYNKVPGDGRELVVCSASAVAIRSEEGRSVSAVDISPFINDLPFGRATNRFTTADASGSTSMAANIQEAVEIGTTCLLLDEDTCASNFMFRDQRMASLVKKDPISPFSRKIVSVAAAGISCILVSGASGDFFDNADTVIHMDSFLPRDVTDAARHVCTRLPLVAGTTTEADRKPHALPSGRPAVRSLFEGAGAPSLFSKTKDDINIGRGEDTARLDLRHLEQIVEHSQVRALCGMLSTVHAQLQGGPRGIADLAASVGALLDGPRGIDALSAGRGDCSRPRLAEIGAALNRVRTMKMDVH